MRSFAALSPRSILFASATSSAAVSRSCFPISFMNSVSESVAHGRVGLEAQLELVVRLVLVRVVVRAPTISTPRASSSLRRSCDLVVLELELDG